MWDVDGTEYVDLHAGFGTTLAGHGHPAIVAAVTDRVAQGTHFAQPTPDIVPVAAELARRFGLPLWRFTNSGTESTLAAIHLMRAVTGRTHLIKVEGTYHGHHDAVQVSVFPDAADFGAPDQPATVREHGAVPPEVAAPRARRPVRPPRRRAPGAARPPRPDRRDDHRAGDDEHRRRRHRRPATSTGCARCCTPTAPCSTFDEVKTGLSIAPGGATERFGVVPDIVCLAKALGGGVPCGAIGGTAEVMDAITDRHRTSRSARSTATR